MNFANRGINQIEAKPGVVVIETCCGAVAERTNAVASRSRSRQSITARRMMRPASVSSSARWRRTNNGMPRPCLICRLTADCVKKSSSAAGVKLNLRAAASKLRNGSRRGSSARAMVAAVTPLLEVFAFAKCMPVIPNERFMCTTSLSIFIPVPHANRLITEKRSLMK